MNRFQKLIQKPIQYFIKNNTKTQKYLQNIFYQQRLRFQYPDMTIHTSQRNMLRFLHNLVQPGHFSIVDTNVNVLLAQSQNLGSSATRLLHTPNAGGSSIYSEALSIELLSRLLGVNLFKTETELEYYFPEENENGGSGPIMDYAAVYYQNNKKKLTLGVSVTRAMAYNRHYTKEDAVQLLTKKLRNMVKSSQGIVNAKFDRHILHVWTESGKNAALVKRVCKKLLKQAGYQDTIVLISTVNTDLVFFNNNDHLLKKSTRK